MYRIQSMIVTSSLETRGIKSPFQSKSDPILRSINFFPETGGREILKFRRFV